MRTAEERNDAALRRAQTHSWAIGRGFVSGALLLLAALGFTFLVAAFLQYRTIARNDEARAREPWSWGPAETRTQALQDRP